jgi:SAM-dependent methyltransferase
LIPCPLCGGTGPKTFVRKHDDYSLYDCPDCGLGYCEPFKNPGAAYYEGNTDQYSVSLSETTDAMSYEYDEGLAYLTRELPRGARVLDVGFGTGGFLFRLKAAGFVPSGVDFNSARVKALAERGFDVTSGGLPDYAPGHQAAFDAVAIFEVIEHVDDLGAWILAAKSVLKPGGVFIVGTPNRDRTFDPFQGVGLEAIDNPPHHLTRWSAAALSDALTRHGFKVRECRPLGYPLPLLRLILRYRLSFGLATKALKVEQVRYAPAGDAAPAGSGLIKTLVALKEALINALAWVIYPFFTLAYKAFGWQGVPLIAIARKDV